MAPNPGVLTQRGPYLLFAFPAIDGLIKMGVHYDPQRNVNQGEEEDVDVDNVDHNVTDKDDGKLLDSLAKLSIYIYIYNYICIMTSYLDFLSFFLIFF